MSERRGACKGDGISLGETPKDHRWARTVPLVGDTSSAAERAASPAGWAFESRDRMVDRAIDRVVACLGADTDQARLLLVAGDHPVAELGVTPYRRSVTRDVLDAALAGSSLGVVTAEASRIRSTVVDAGAAEGDLVSSDALPVVRVAELIAAGDRHAAEVGRGLLLLGEVGVGNTAVAAALAAVLLDRPVEAMVGLGSGTDSAMAHRKREVAEVAVARFRSAHPSGFDMVELLASIGGPEFAVIYGAVIGAARRGGVVVLDGFATGVAALAACRTEPAVTARLIAGQRSNEPAHGDLLLHLGLEPLIDLRLRAGEGIGAVLTARTLLDAMTARRAVARTSTQ